MPVSVKLKEGIDIEKVKEKKSLYKTV